MQYQSDSLTDPIPDDELVQYVFFLIFPPFFLERIKTDKQMGGNIQTFLHHPVEI